MVFQRAHSVAGALAAATLVGAALRTSEDTSVSPSVTSAVAAETTVRNAGPALHPRGASFNRVLTVGRADGPTEYLLQSVGSVAVRDDGVMYVVDWDIPALRMYDPSGKFVRALGRAGQGPGEYVRPKNVIVLDDGRALLLDSGNGRVDVYGKNGEVLPSWRVATRSTNIFSDRAGFVYVQQELQPGSPMPGDRKWLLERRRSDGVVVDTILVPRLLPPLPVLMSATGQTGGVVPYVPQELWAWSPAGYLVTGVSSRYAFELLIPRGGTSPPTWTERDGVLSVRRDVPPVMVTADERNERRDRTTATLRVKDPSWRWNGPEIPSTKPFYKTLWVDADARMWVSVSMPSIRVNATSANPGWSEAPAFDLFEPNGRYVGRLDGPAANQIVFARGDSVWSVVRDSDGVESIAKFTITWR